MNRDEDVSNLKSTENRNVISELSKKILAECNQIKSKSENSKMVESNKSPNNMKIIKSYLAYILIFYIFVGGYYESYTKHGSGDLVLSIVIPPWGWYRSGELLYYAYGTDDPREVLIYNSNNQIQLVYGLKEFKSKEVTDEDIFAVYNTYKELAMLLNDGKHNAILRKMVRNKDREKAIWDVLSAHSFVREALHKKMNN